MRILVVGILVALLSGFLLMGAPVEHGYDKPERHETRMLICDRPDHVDPVCVEPTRKEQRHWNQQDADGAARAP